ncbi:hypothetical protein ACPPVW_04965 [Leifsonia sp. McL0607]|uniref:hypothetical protein n=1 Tax=Leifsonia sp. McL0607 TaxID=3415672 RepID=UPI003CE95E01
MVALIIILLVVWLVLAILGFAVKGLLWLAILGIAFFVITAIVGWLRRGAPPAADFRRQVQRVGRTRRAAEGAACPANSLARSGTTSAQPRKSPARGLRAHVR